MGAKGAIFVIGSACILVVAYFACKWVDGDFPAQDVIKSTFKTMGQQIKDFREWFKKKLPKRGS